MDILLGYAIGIAAIIFIGKLLIVPFEKIIKFVLNGVAGAIILLILNWLGIHVGINIISALIAGFFGIPGVIFLIILNAL